MRFSQILFLLLSVVTGQSLAASALPPINPERALYEVAVEPNVTYEDVILSLKTVSEGMNMVSPAQFPIAEHLKQRGIVTEGPLETRAFCNLGQGTEILLDHPEFVVFAPCRVAIYQRKGQLYIGLDRPTFDLKSIHSPTERAKKAAQTLENALIQLIDKARKGEF